MHLFFFDLKNQLDMLAPIIFNLSYNQKVIIVNLNPFLNLNENNNKLLNRLLEQKNILYVNIYKKKNVFNIYFRFLLYFFKKIIISSYRLRSFFYRSSIQLNHNFFKKFISEKVLSINFEESLPEKKQKYLYKTFKNIFKVHKHHGGLNTLQAITQNDIFDNCDYYFSPNKLGKSDQIIKNPEFKNFGSPRYDKSWINVLKNIYLKQSSLNFARNEKIKVGFIFDPNAPNIKQIYDIEIALEKNVNIELKKSRKTKNTYKLEEKNAIQATEILMWSDIIISHPSSIILEAIIMNKIIIFPEYILKLSKQYDNSIFKDCNSILNMETLEDITNFVFQYKKEIKLVQNTAFLKKVIGYSDTDIIKNYLIFYKELNKQ